MNSQTAALNDGKQCLHLEEINENIVLDNIRLVIV